MKIIEYVPNVEYLNRYDEGGSSEKYWNEEIEKREKIMKRSFKDGVLKIAFCVIKGVVAVGSAFVTLKFVEEAKLAKALLAVNTVTTFGMIGLLFKQAKRKFNKIKQLKADISCLEARKECDKEFAL